MFEAAWASPPAWGKTGTTAAAAVSASATVALMENARRIKVSFLSLSSNRLLLYTVLQNE